MIRPARTASLLLTFSVLTSAATAYAECAWVLWMGTPEERRWSPIRAMSAQATCEQARDTKVVEDTAQAAADQKALEKYGLQGGKVVSHTFLCLPDTIDPRGPKGK